GDQGVERPGEVGVPRLAALRASEDHPRRPHDLGEAHRPEPIQQHQAGVERRGDRRGRDPLERDPAALHEFLASRQPRPRPPRRDAPPAGRPRGPAGGAGVRTPCPPPPPKGKGGGGRPPAGQGRRRPRPPRFPPPPTTPGPPPPPPRAPPPRQPPGSPSLPNPC